MKKILILHTGGTFGMVPKKPKPTLKPNEVQKNITTYVPELERIAQIDFEMVFNIDSADIQPTHWQQLATLIFNKLDSYDGFVIIHGTDSMVYTASALSFMLQNLPKPVILTGSQRPLAEIRTDARMNLINAVELATKNIPEVCICFEQALLRGNRAIKISSTDYGAFTSPNFPELANVGLEIKLSDKIHHPEGQVQLFSNISDEVLVLPFFPGVHPEYLRGLVHSPIKAVLMEALGMGNVAAYEKSFINLTKRLIKANKMVVVTSQCHHGHVDLSRYENGMKLAAAGAIGANDMTTEAATVKLMHLLGKHSHNLEAIKKEFIVPIAGEVSV